jgi:GNAT superfamily N-acetyltransferase
MIETRLCLPDEIRTAVRLVVGSYAASPAAELDQQVDALLSWMNASHEAVRHAHVLATDSGRPISACLCFDTPGRVGMLYLPRVTSTAFVEDVIVRSLRRVVEAAEERGLNFLQVLLDPGGGTERRVLSSAGFRPLATLDYMERSAAAAAPRSRGAENVDWRSYVHVAQAEFAAAIEATYQGSLDCPALTGLRSIEDVLASHRATGDYLPEHWYVARVDGSDAGVLILAGSPTRSAIEIVYMGVAPSHRGRGLALAMLHRALSISRTKRAESLILAVDASNMPARSRRASARQRRR